MSFTRRYSSYPGLQVVEQIEGIVIITLPPPVIPVGNSVGVVAIVGECTDVTYGVAVDNTGKVTTNPQPVQIFGGQDLINKIGGFDETLGDTGGEGGNVFVSLRNKSFSFLVVVPVNNAAAYGVRLFRFLPTNTSALLPTPVVPTTAATVPAGTQFVSSGNRARTCAARQFTSFGPYAQGIDGSVTAIGSPGATGLFTSAGSHFTTANNGGPVQKGDILVVGTIGGAGSLGANALTLRVEAVATVDTQLTVETMNGANFDWTSGGSLPFRIHPSTDADTGGIAKFSDSNGYMCPARPLDATIASATVCPPTVVPPALTATSADPLSGLELVVNSAQPLTYSAAVHAPNVASSSTLDALYTPCFDALLSTSAPATSVDILVSSRKDSTLRNYMKTHVGTASSQGIGRMCVISPPLTTVTTSAATAAADPGVGANRNQRVMYSWPGASTFVPEAVGFAMKGADGVPYTTGILDTAADVWLAAVLSNIPPEHNPGELSTAVTNVLAPILGFQRLAPNLGIQDYIAMKANGICGLNNDPDFGFIFQSGITSSIINGQQNINRQRMEDFCTDSLATALKPFQKAVLTNSERDAAVGVCDAFCDILLSPNNPPAQRIAGYLIDDKSANTQATLATGAFFIIVKIQMLPTADEIVLLSQVGPTVSVTPA